ncbi:hypothetical protein JMJ58_15095 [Haloterrigena salifodinae]|uniref:RelE toxin-related domain-containing protein n=1 Tax=Haloterrigena salifodinae TaxID=2675099 RepID=A0A8T8DXE3_9EURY|nr:hypothetical protein [Haloterrigena salifodinae]QRV14258.1 hypothetical protein JMJ58_15095 [Haloterrigena salifodinae]
MSIVDDVGVTAGPTFEEISVSSHCRERWDERSDRPLLNPRIAWLEAVPVDYPSARPPARHARFHEVTELILLASDDGLLRTCIPLSNRPRDERRYIRDQLEVDA